MADNFTPSIKEQLLALRWLTAKTGGLHEAQVQQLRNWPYACQPEGLESFEISVDFEGNLVVYDLVLSQKKSKKLEYLHTWVKWLLGDEWKVEIHVSKWSSKKSNNDNSTRRKRKGTRTC